MSIIAGFLASLLAVAVVCAAFEAVWDFLAVRLGWSFTFRLGERIRKPGWWIACVIGAVFFMLV